MFRGDSLRRGWDIDKVDGASIASPSARSSTIRLMRLLNRQVGTRLAPYELLCAGNGRNDPTVDALSMKGGQVMPGFTSKYVGDHTNHIHIAY